MINKMRLKFIAITMGALVLLLISILVSTNVVMQNSNERTTNELLHSLIDSNGITPETPIKPGSGPPHAQPNDLTEAFCVKLDTDGNITEVLNNDTTNEEEIIELAAMVMDEGLTEGKISNYKYIIAQKDYGQIMVFADQSVQNQLLDNLKTFLI